MTFVKFDDVDKNSKGALSIKSNAHLILSNLRPEWLVRRNNLRGSISPRSVIARMCVLVFMIKRSINQLVTSDISEHWEKTGRESLATFTRLAFKVTQIALSAILKVKKMMIKSSRLSRNL